MSFGAPHRIVHIARYFFFLQGYSDQMGIPGAGMAAQYVPKAVSDQVYTNPTIRSGCFEHTLSCSIQCFLNIVAAC